VPASNVFVPLKIPTADRFLYLPLMGLALGAGELIRLWGRPARLAVPAALAVLAVLTVTRIGDWRDDASILATWTRVNPKSRRVVWAEAAEHARAADEALQREDFEEALPEVDRAVHLYDLYLRNAAPIESIGVYLEMGDLLYNTGQWLTRLDQRAPAINAYSGSIEAYLHAHRLHELGIGALNREAVYHAADQIVALCLQLATPDNPRQDETVKLGLKTIQFLEAEFGQRDPGRFAQLLLIHCIRIRALDPAKARSGLDEVDRLLNMVEEAHGDATFLRGQSLFYRSILKDAEPDRAGLERARELFDRAARGQRDQRLRALFLGARASCTIGRVFHDQAMVDDGIARLDALRDRAAEERIRISQYMAAEIEGERRACKAR